MISSHNGSTESVLLEQYLFSIAGMQEVMPNLPVNYCILFVLECVCFALHAN